MTTPPPGVVNFRDAGGHATPHGTMAIGRLFRSAHLVDLADPRALDPYGVTTVVDLRNAQERIDHPSRLSSAITVFDIDIDTGAWGDVAQRMPRLEEVYLGMIEDRATRLVQAVDTIARRSHSPVLVHCTGGKDRTGVVIALVQAVLGVPDDAIAADYARSEAHLMAAWRVSPPPKVAGGVDWDEFVAAGLLASPPEMMFDVLGRLRREHGSVEGFLTVHGADERLPELLHRHLVSA